MNKTAPSYAPIINRQATKIARIIVSSALFAIVHAQLPFPPYNTTANLAHKFVMGLILGGIQEVSGNPLLSMAFHCGNNIGLATSFVGQPVGCGSDASDASDAKDSGLHYLCDRLADICRL